MFFMEGKLTGRMMLTFIHELMPARFVSLFPSFLFSDQAEVKEINLTVLKIVIYFSYLSLL